MNDAYDRFEGLTLLVNSAAGMQKTRLGHTTAAEFDAIVGLNLRAPFLLAQAAARLMPAGGCIVNIADHMAEEPWPDYSVHGIAKAGVIAMTRHLAAALAPDLRVNAIAPGFVLAPPGMPESAVQQFAEQTPLQRVGRSGRRGAGAALPRQRHVRDWRDALRRRRSPRPPLARPRRSATAISS